MFAIAAVIQAAAAPFILMNSRGRVGWPLLFLPFRGVIHILNRGCPIVHPYRS
jgi:hypothetical protein